MDIHLKCGAQNCDWQNFSCSLIFVYTWFSCFQVTLTAETDCRYVSWRRKKLYLLFAQYRYISRLFSVLIGSDIADKLYALNDRVYIGRRYHYDIRLPNFYQLAGPEKPRSPLIGHFRNSRQHCDKWHWSLKFYNYIKKRLSSSFPKWNSKIQKIAIINIFYKSNSEAKCHCQLLYSSQLLHCE